MRQTVVDVNLPEKTSKRKKRAATLVSSSADTVAARVTDLPAYTEVEMQVSVLNRKYQGQPSARIKFTTKQGGECQTKHEFFLSLVFDFTK